MNFFNFKSNFKIIFNKNVKIKYCKQKCVAIIKKTMSLEIIMSLGYI